MSIIDIRLPNAGLANKLLIWSEAIVFKKMNSNVDFKIVVGPWHDFHLKRILFNNRDKRSYKGFFKSNDFENRIKSIFLKGEKIYPSVEKIDVKLHGVYVFDKIPSKVDYFKNLRGHEDYIKESLFKIINPRILIEYSNLNNYDLALHIRRGDFGSEIRTDLDYFITCYNAVSDKLGYIPQTIVFTDGEKSELKDLLMLPGVSLSENNNPIIDLLWMSKAKIIVPSIRSTFSYFACFISDAKIIRHNNDCFGKISDRRRFEGVLKDYLFNNI